MKKLIIAALMLCILLSACGKKTEDTNTQDTTFTQSVSISYSMDKDFGDMLVKLLNSVAIKQKIGIAPSDVNSITVEREPEKEKPAENGRYNNVIKVTVNTEDRKRSQEIFDTFYDKAKKGVAALVESDNVTVEKVD